MEFEEEKHNGKISPQKAQKCLMMKEWMLHWKKLQKF